MGGAIRTFSGKLTVVDSIFKKNKAFQVESESGSGGAIYAGDADIFVLSSLFELNEASNIGGAALFASPSSVAWYNNKELLFGNDAELTKIVMEYQWAEIVSVLETTFPNPNPKPWGLLGR